MMLTFSRYVRTFLLTITLLTVVLPAAANEQIVLQRTNKPCTAILFDIGGVLAKINTFSLIHALGCGHLCSYSLTAFTSPLALREKMQYTLDYLAQRDGIGAHPENAIVLDGRPIPLFMQEWQKGTNTCHEVETYVLQAIAELKKKKCFTNKREVRLVKKLAHCLIDAPMHCSLDKLIQPMFESLKKIKSQNPQIKLIIASNMPPEQAAAFRKQFPELVALFDDAIFSGEIGYAKPETEFFTHILAKHALNPATTLFVDNEKPNIKAAQKIGLKTFYIHDNNFAEFESFLVRQTMLAFVR